MRLVDHLYFVAEHDDQHMAHLAVGENKIARLDRNQRPCSRCNFPIYGGNICRFEHMQQVI
jgi:hypothetical protein